MTTRLQQITGHRKGEERDTPRCNIEIYNSGSINKSRRDKGPERERERADLNGETVRLGVVHRDQEHGGRLRLVGQLKQTDITAGNLGPVRL